jgi:PTH1 family peptidyl-tRNA hydrolase
LVYNYVLQDFAKNELPWVGAICGAVSENAGLLMTGNNDATFKINVNLAMVAADLLPSDGARPLPPS